MLKSTTLQQAETTEISVSWSPLEAALSISNVSRFLLTTLFEKELIKMIEIAFNAEWEAFYQKSPLKWSVL